MMNELTKDRPTSEQLVEILDNEPEIAICSDVVHGLDYEYKQLQIENKWLKNQLKNCYCNRTDCSSRIKNSKKYDSLVQKVENQQKEFIEWLESEIERIPTFTTFFYNREGHYVSETEVMQKEVNKVYKKYKEIIGVKDEKDNSI